jgi:hypothetical protein
MQLLWECDRLGVSTSIYEVRAGWLISNHQRIDLAVSVNRAKGSILAELDNYVKFYWCSEWFILLQTMHMVMCGNSVVV